MYIPRVVHSVIFLSTYSLAKLIIFSGILSAFLIQGVNLTLLRLRNISTLFLPTGWSHLSTLAFPALPTVHFIVKCNSKRIIWSRICIASLLVLWRLFFCLSVPLSHSRQMPSIWILLFVPGRRSIKMFALRKATSLGCATSHAEHLTYLLSLVVPWLDYFAWCARSCTHDFL